MRRVPARQMAMAVAMTASAVASGALSACSASTDVQIVSSPLPAVASADDGLGQNDAAVIEAGAIDLDDPATTATTTTTTRTTGTAPDPAPDGDDSTPTTEVSKQAAEMIAEMCRGDRRGLKLAVDGYRADYAMAPTSEADLIAFGYIRQLSDLFDVFVDGSIVVQGSTCARTH